MKNLYILQSSILEDIPWWTWVGGAIFFIGLIIWRYLRRRYPSLAKIERFFDDFNRNEAVSTSINDAYPRAEVEDFPLHPVSEDIRIKLARDGEVDLGPGIYDFYLQSFCIGAGKYAPTTGSGYLIAPLIKGTKSSIIKSILKNSIKQLISQNTVQTLIWAIESGSKYDEMPSNLQSTMDQLLNEEEIKSLGRSFWERIPKGILNLILAGVRSKLPQEMLQMFNAYNAIKELILDPNMSYENLIATAVRYGEPSPPENMIKIESGEWCETPDGYFIRALTRDSFSRLRIQIYVPESNVAPNNNPDLHNPNTEDMKITFDPSKIIAVPANTNKQRLGLRPKEEEEEEGCSINITSDNAIICVNENVTLTANVGQNGTVNWNGGENPSSGIGIRFTTSFASHGMKNITAILTTNSQTCNDTIQIRVKELSGPQWVARFPTSRNTADLTPAFQLAVNRFIAALRAAGANIIISATYRPVERAFLMHYSFRIAREGFDPNNVPQQAGIEICWLHRDNNGNPNLGDSRAAAEQMVQAYNIVHRPALVSRHTQRRAIDMTITWAGDLAITDGNGIVVNINSLPRNGANNADLHAVGASYGVIKLVGDAPHWSDDGH